MLTGLAGLRFGVETPLHPPGRATRRLDGLSSSEETPPLPTLSPQRSRARRALIADLTTDKRGWLEHGIAALAVSLLGLGVAGSFVLTGNAQHTTASPSVVTSVQPGVAQPSAFDRDAAISRSAQRKPLDPAAVKNLAQQRADALSRTGEQVELAAQSKAVAKRARSLVATSKATLRQGVLLAAQKSTGASGTQTDATIAASLAALGDNSGKACLPVTSGYTIAARFGDVGSWSRYHTGFDFSAPVGTPIHAPIAGVVTNAGYGPASGWAGNYVAIKYPNGMSTLMAHMSTVSVKVGETVRPCQVVGAIGMTGRSFGPHVHFEVYPAGITPGDVYKAINPEPWLHALGLRP
jgi:murein DD-endopeptidase MepM/ murein hydrolase activator NlpD